jgi:rare lipoprotein A
MNPAAMTAAHKSLPFGSVVKVTDQNTGKSINVTINDRGPFIRGRIIDLSQAAASRLGFQNKGVTQVCITRV